MFLLKKGEKGNAISIITESSNEEKNESSQQSGVIEEDKMRSSIELDF